MKATVSQSDLSQALKALSRNIDKRSKAPILLNFLLTADSSKGTLTITAANLGKADVSAPVLASAEILAAVESPGSVTAPAIFLRDIVNGIPKSLAVTLSDDSEGKLRVSSDKGSVETGTDPADDFPTLYPSGLAQTFSIGIDSGEFSYGVGNTSFSISRDPVKAILNGLNFKVRGNSLTLAATDGHRLSVHELSGEIDTDESDLDFTVPLVIIDAVSKVIGKKPAFPLVKITGYKGNSAEVSYGPYKFTFSQVSGTYPNYHQLTPNSFDKVAIIDREPLIDALERAGKVASLHNNVARLEFIDGELAVSASDGDKLNYREVIPAELRGDDILIGFNFRYLVEALKSKGLSGNTVTLSMNGPTNPAVLTSDVERNLHSLIMPVQIRS